MLLLCGGKNPEVLIFTVNAIVCSKKTGQKLKNIFAKPLNLNSTTILKLASVTAVNHLTQKKRLIIENVGTKNVNANSHVTLTK